MEPRNPHSVSAFRASLAATAPPAGLGVPAQALWWAAKDEWDKAHSLVQDEESREAAWVHAYLHRVEGDLDNARCWYGRAGRKEGKGPLDAEWMEVAAALLEAR